MEVVGMSWIVAGLIGAVIGAAIMYWCDRRQIAALEARLVARALTREKLARLKRQREARS